MTLDELKLIYAVKFGERKKDANKGTYGRLLIIAGSPGMAGAAYLSGLAAFKTGVGMVKYFGPEANRMILQTLLPEAMYESWPDYECSKDYSSDASTFIGISPVAIDKLKKNLKWADYVVLGPGLSTNELAVCLIKTLFKAEMCFFLRDKKLVVIDADALNIISSLGLELKNLDDGSGTNIVVTPHIAEMRRLLLSDLKRGIRPCHKSSLGLIYKKNAFLSEIPGENKNLLEREPQKAELKEKSFLEAFTFNDIKENAKEIACGFGAKHGVIVVLKDSVTTVSAAGDTYSIDAGTAGMAKAGSGDVLTGFLCGTKAILGVSPRFTVPLGVYLHALAGSLATNSTGIHSLLARDIAFAAGKAIELMSKNNEKLNTRN